MKPKKKRKIKVAPEAADKDGVPKTEGDTKPGDAKPLGDANPVLPLPRETYGEVLENFQKSGDLMLLALDRKSGSAQVVLTPNSIGDLHEACHYLVGQ